MTDKKQFQKPEYWDDDERMNALFQPFRPRQINPHHYDIKLKFWEDLVYQYCKYKKGEPSFSKNEVQLEYKRKERLTLCLDTVIEDMIAQKIIQNSNDFMSNPYNTWTTWAVNSFVKSPVKWGFNKFWGRSDVDMEHIRFYHKPLLKELSDELMHTLNNHPGKVLKTDDLATIVKPKLHLNENGLNICLFYLYQQSKILLEFDLVKENIQINLVKIPGGKNITENKFTEYDKTMIKLQETKSVLLDQINKLEEEVSKHQALAKKSLMEKNQRMAKIHLKRKLFVQNQCDKKSNILHNVETLIANMEDAESNGEILNVYKMGVDSLKGLMSKSGLSLENVDEIMSTMKEVTEEHDEIQSTMSNIDSNTSGFNDDSLEAELNEILGENNGTKAKLSEMKSFDIAQPEISDKELIDLLEGLEVVTNTPNTSIISSGKSVRY